jgi:inosose dehydratase
MQTSGSKRPKKKISVAAPFQTKEGRCMEHIRIANAPCSWGALEFEGMQGEQIGYSQMLDELRDTGYVGTELGDWGYMPTDPAQLRQELERRQLAMVGAFVPVALKYAEKHVDGEAEALRVARLLAGVAQKGDSQPLIILADENGSDPVRTQNAGRITSAMALTDDEWRTFAQGAERIARTVQDATGLATAFHHHCAGYVETPTEIARLLDMTRPDVLGLVFDTGHYLYGSGSNEAQIVLDGLQRFGARITHVHFKDCQPQIAQQARQNGWDYFTAIQHGVFCELGRGSVPFPGVREWLATHQYAGWIVVEQDVLPGMGTPKSSAERNRTYLSSLGL